MTPNLPHQLIHACVSAIAVWTILFSVADASSPTKGQPKQSQQEAVCRFIAQQFSRPVQDYVRDYGPIVSSESRSLEKGLRVVRAQLARQIILSYSSVEGESRESVNNVEAKGIPAWQMLGLEIHSVKDVREILGNPDWTEGKLTTYYSNGCPGSPRRVLEIDIEDEVLIVRQVDSTN